MNNTLPKPQVIIPQPKPAPKRLSERPKRMTLVAAFRCSHGGFMLCADREENDGYTRREVDKTYLSIVSPSCEMLIAGSGPSGLVTKANSEIQDALVNASNKGADILRGHKEIIESTLNHIHKQYAANIKQGYPDLLILIASVVPGGAPLLYRTELAMLVPEPSYAAYGSGKPVCDYFADRLYANVMRNGPRLDRDSMKIMGALILREAEKTASGVGLGADMWFFHDGDKQAWRIQSGFIREIQSLIPPIEESLWSDWKAKVKIPYHFPR